VSVLEEVLVETGEIEHALQDGVPKSEERYMKQVLPMLSRPTRARFFDFIVRVLSGRYRRVLEDELVDYWSFFQTFGSSCEGLMADLVTSLVFLP
jgi:hypothetical protein